MALSMHTIKPSGKASKKRKRIGRGNASGHGTYSTRGLKGQRSRSGVSNLKRLGMKKILLSIPKKRGFKSSKPKDQVVSFASINKYFKDNQTINAKILMGKGLIDSLDAKVKILGGTELKVKGLDFQQIKASESAKKMIEKMNGKISSLSDKK
jgi:large subunit ribosomal protein L15